MAKSLGIAILLAVLVSGVGHIYLGIINRGVIILIIGIVAWMVVSAFVPFPYSWVIIIGYWIWQIWDAYKYYKKLNPGKPQITK